HSLPCIRHPAVTVQYKPTDQVTSETPPRARSPAETRLPHQVSSSQGIKIAPEQVLLYEQDQDHMRRALVYSRLRSEPPERFPPRTSCLNFARQGRPQQQT